MKRTDRPLDGYSDDFAVYLQRLVKKMPLAQQSGEKPKVKLAKKRKAS